MMTDDLIEDRLRESLRAAASCVAEVEPPLLSEHPSTGRAHRSLARPLALVACLLAIGGLSIAALRDGHSEALRAIGTPDTADTADTARPPLPEGLRLLRSVDAGEDHVHELWAYQDRGTPCIVMTQVVDGDRRYGGSDCPRPPICIDPAWTEFVPGGRDVHDPATTDCSNLTTVPTLGPGTENGWEFIHGGVLTAADDRLPGTPVLAVGRVDPRVATWETSGESPLEPFEVVHHPDDADLRYLFGVVPQAGQDTTITLRDSSGGFLAQITLSR